LEFKEAKPPPRTPGPIYNFRRGYKVERAGQHESADQYAAFQLYVQLAGKRSLQRVADERGHAGATVVKWAHKFEWERRAAAWDKQQMAMALRETQKDKQNQHRQSIVEFRNAAERQARMMSRVSEDLVRVLGKRIAKFEEDGNQEEIPISLVGGLLRAAAGLNEQSRESWGAALGVNELLSVVEEEVEKVRVEELNGDTNPYEFEVEE
jgi:hypothetical protein